MHLHKCLSWSLLMHIWCYFKLRGWQMMMWECSNTMSSIISVNDSLPLVVTWNDDRVKVNINMHIINHCSLYNELLSAAVMMRRDACSQTSAAHHCALLEMRAPVSLSAFTLTLNTQRDSPSSGCLSHQHYPVSTFHRILDNIVFTVWVHSRNNVLITSDMKCFL